MDPDKLKHFNINEGGYIMKHINEYQMISDDLEDDSKKQGLHGMATIENYSSLC